MVYPPGALVVELNALSVDAKFNVSVFHVHNPMEDTNYISDIWCKENVSSDSASVSFPEDAHRLATCFTEWYVYLFFSLYFIFKSTITTGLYTHMTRLIQT